MSCVGPVGRIPSGGEDVSDSHEDRDQRPNRAAPSLLPALLPPAVPSPVLPPTDQTFLQASVIFQQLRKDKPDAQQRLQYERKTDAPLPACGDEAARRQAYQLAFSALKYQDLLEDVIADSCFHTSQHITSDLLPLAMVMLYDFQDRRFPSHERSARAPEEPAADVGALRSRLHRCRTKLAASLARCRVKHDLQSVSCFLADSVRTKHQRAKRLPLYAWVNTLKISVEEMCDVLQSAGWSEGKSAADPGEPAFCRDPLCADALVFPRHLGDLLRGHSLTDSHVLNVQDRSLCVAVSALQPLLFDNYDVLLVGSFSAVTVAHVAVVAAGRPGRVLVCGADHTASHVQEIKELLTQMNLKNVRVTSGAFYSLDDGDAAIRHLKVILVLPRCSTSGLCDPVSTIHSEHGDWDVLADLCNGSVSKRKIHALAAQQAKLLAHALSFSKVQTVVYCTRSVYPEENEQLVKRVLDKTHTHPKLLPFRVSGPIFPGDSQAGDTPESKFFRLEASPFTNGCFVARLSRQADPTKVETVHDVLARAAAKGLLGGILPEESKTVKKGKNRKHRADSVCSQPPSPCSEERPTASEPGTGQGPVGPSDERERGEVAFECSEEEGERTKEEGTGARKAEKKTGQKRRHKRAQKQAPKESQQQDKRHKKKRKRSKPRRIPRLTLTLMSSAKPSKHLSPITAAAHKFVDPPGTRSQQATDVITTPPSGRRPSPAGPAPPSPQAADTHETRKDADESQRKAGPEVKVVTQAAKAADFVLPPISSHSLLSVHSKSSSNMSASSSSVYLPGL